MQWATAMSSAYGLNSGECGLTDGSAEGDWHLATAEELQQIGTIHPIVDWWYEKSDGWRGGPGEPFVGVQSFQYWSSSNSPISPERYPEQSEESPCAGE